jgi:hypothetical protein
MQNSSFGRQYRRTIVLRSKSRQLRHAQSLLRQSAANNRRNEWVSRCETQGRSGNREGERQILPATALDGRGYFPSRCSRPSLQSHIPNLIVVGISCGNDLHASIYQDRRRAKRAERLNNNIRVELEFSSLQDFAVFFKDFFANVTLEISGKSKSED